MRINFIATWNITRDKIVFTTVVAGCPSLLCAKIEVFKEIELSNKEKIVDCPGFLFSLQ